jgi:hypothetical protein
VTDASPPRQSWWLGAAIALNVLGIAAVASALVRFNSITLMLSVGVGGALLCASWAIFIVNVVADLRRRRVF